MNFAFGVHFATIMASATGFDTAYAELPTKRKMDTNTRIVRNQPQTKRTINTLARRLARFFAESDAPVTRLMALQRGMPYQVLVSALLSARTRDQITIPVARTLLKAAPTPAALRSMPLATLESMIRPCGFYHDKAMHLLALADRLHTDFNGHIPERMEELLTLPGIGRKTANLVLSLGCGKPAISVDIHVHRISNRMGLVSTQRPEQTEIALQNILPQRIWSDWNPWLVALGQRICLPRQPKCRLCPIQRVCETGRTNR